MGKYRTWYNVRDENLEERSVDLGQIEWKKVPESELNITSVTDSLGSVSKEIIIAKENELNKLALFDTYQEVTDCGQKYNTVIKISVLLNFLLTVKVAPDECVIRTGLP